MVKENIDKELNFDDSVLEKIAGQTATQVDGILMLSGGVMSKITDRFRDEVDPTQGVDVETDEESISVELDAVLEYGKSAPKIFDQLIAKIAQEVNTMTGLTVKKVTLNVTDLLTKKEWSDKNESKKDKKDKHE